MRPSMDGNLVTVVIGALQGCGVADGAGSDDEEGCLGAVGLEVVVQTG